MGAPRDRGKGGGDIKKDCTVKSYQHSAVGSFYILKSYITGRASMQGLLKGFFRISVRGTT